jgi:hypothetical protein
MMTPATEEMNLLVINPRYLKLQTHPLWILQLLSDSANGEGIELVADRCRACTQARKYNDRWVICTGPHTCKRTGYKGKRDTGSVGKLVFYIAV